MPTRPDHVGRLLLHRPLGAAAAQAAVAWSRARGLDPHINHLERLVIRADDPRVDDYSAFLGTRATRVDDLATWIERPGDEDRRRRPARVADEPTRRGRGGTSPAGPTSRGASPIPRVRGAGRVQGSGRAMDGASERDPARADARDRRPVERPGDAVPRSATARRCPRRRRRSLPPPATSRLRSPRRVRP